MSKTTRIALVAACTVSALITFFSAAQAQELKRTELKRGDLTGTNMEVLVQLLELPPGLVVPLHTHPGEEAFYVIDGGVGELSDGKQIELVSGSANIVARDVPHGGLKVAGDKPIKLLTVYIVDKGKPLVPTIPEG
jgi:quercetin dioxygenase-like cupin family protein